MAKNYTKQISEILLTLKNINDNLHSIEDQLVEVNKMVNRPAETPTMKHIVVIKNQEPSTKKAKEEYYGKIS